MRGDREHAGRGDMSPFETYLRTGKRIAASPAQIEVKFNPWHDPANGRFTFAQNGTGGGRRPDGSWGGGGFTGGGGGSGGGAGATGTDVWPANIFKARPAKRSRPLATDTPVSTERASGRPTADSSGAWHTVVKNGYSFRIDAQGRTREVRGRITLALSDTRSRTMQATAGGADRLPTDDGGHYIALRFHGPREVYNHFAQDRNFNRGEYRTLEQGWARSVADGHRVSVAIGPAYVGASKRPAGLYLSVTNDGHTKSQYLGNRSRRI